MVNLYPITRKGNNVEKILQMQFNSVGGLAVLTDCGKIWVKYSSDDDWHLVASPPGCFNSHTPTEGVHRGLPRLGADW